MNRRINFLWLLQSFYHNWVLKTTRIWSHWCFCLFIWVWGQELLGRL